MTSVTFANPFTGCGLAAVSELMIVLDLIEKPPHFSFTGEELRLLQLLSPHFHPPRITHLHRTATRSALSSLTDNLALYATPPVTPTPERLAASTDTSLGQSQAPRMSGMDGDEQGRSRFQQSNHPRPYAPHPRAANAHHVRTSPSSGRQDRLEPAQAYLTRSPLSATLPTGSGNPQDIGSYGYAHGQQYPASQVHAGGFSYPPEYSQDPQRSQQYPTYGPQMIYNVPQQVQTQSPYQLVSPYQPRQSTAVEVLSSQFGTPQQYFNTSGSQNVSGPSALPQQYAATPYQHQMQYNPQADLGQSDLASAYSALDSEISPGLGAEVAGQEEQDDVGLIRDQYQKLLRETNEKAYRGRLIEGAETLLQMSELLLGRCEALGLHRDVQELHDERLKLWKDFNNSWLALLQRQFEDTQKEAAGVLAAGRNILPEKTVERLAEELIRLCDGVAQHGLVDYEMGVWEDEIISMIMKSKSLFNEDDEDEASAP